MSAKTVILFCAQALLIQVRNFMKLTNFLNCTLQQIFTASVVSWSLVMNTYVAV